MPSKKRRRSVNRRNVIMIVSVSAILLLSCAVYLYWSESNRVRVPSLSSFNLEDWMFFVPSDVERFRFLNISELASFPGLFVNTNVLSLQKPQLNISLVGMQYGLEVETKDSAVANILGVNASTANWVNEILVEGGLASTSYKNVTLYKVEPTKPSLEKTAWISVFNGVVIYCEGDEPAVRALKSVIDASVQAFFVNDAFKVGYLVTCGDEKPFAFSFFRFEDNDLKIRWAMQSAFGSDQLTKREVFFLATKEEAESKYQEVVQKLLLKAKRTSNLDNFILAEFVYPSSEIRSLIMGM